jgi:hypothetical protein
MCDYNHVPVSFHRLTLSTQNSFTNATQASGLTLSVLELLSDTIPLFETRWKDQLPVLRAIGGSGKNASAKPFSLLLGDESVCLGTSYVVPSANIFLGEWFEHRNYTG